MIETMHFVEQKLFDRIQKASVGAKVFGHGVIQDLIGAVFEATFDHLTLVRFTPCKEFSSILILANLRGVSILDVRNDSKNPYRKTECQTQLNPGRVYVI